MLLDSLLGIALHIRYDRRVDLQPISVDVVGGAVRLMVLVAPAVEGVGLPLDAVIPIAVVLPGGVVTRIGLASHHDLAKVLTEVGSCALLVIHLVEGGADRKLRERIHLTLREVASLLHLLEDGVASLQWLGAIST